MSDILRALVSYLVRIAVAFLVSTLHLVDLVPFCVVKSYQGQMLLGLSTVFQQIGEDC